MTDEAAAALLARKKRTRSGHRASTSRFVNQATTALEESDVDTDQLSLINRMLVEKIETLKVLDSELADLVPDDELEEEIQRADEYKEKVYGVMAKLKKALGTPPAPTAGRTVTPTPLSTEPPTLVVTASVPTTAATASPTDSTASSTEPPAAVVTASGPTATVRTSSISLPHFRGNLIRWPAFWDHSTQLSTLTIVCPRSTSSST